MAARENQGYLVAVILLVLLSVILSIATYFGFTGLNDVSDKLAKAESDFANERAAQTAYQEQAAILKSYLGLEGLGDNYSMALVPQRIERIGLLQGQEAVITETQTITDLYNADMKRYISKDDGEEGTWRGLVDDFAAAIAANYNTIQVQKNTHDLAEAEFQKDLAKKDETIKTAETALQQAQTDLNTEKGLHTKTRQELTDQLNKSNAALNSKIEELGIEQGKWSQERDRLESQNSDNLKAIAALKTRLKSMEIDQNEIADGRIISVAPILGKVWINLGYDDNLRQQQTFSVYDQGETIFTEDNIKAKIEITKVTNPHIAEARIIDQDTINPILTQDYVLTPVWEPGYAVPIAVAGSIDLDGDGISDLQRLISIIERNGGKVVAYHDEEGNVVGNIDENTRFFVVGDEPNSKMMDGYTLLNTQRQQFEIGEKSVQELLNGMGFNSEAKVQRLENQRIRFTPRQPGTAGGSAFEEEDK